MRGENEPVAIEQNDDVGGDQVDTKPTRSSRQQEGELLRTRSVVLVDSRDSIFVSGPSIDSAVFCTRNRRKVVSSRLILRQREEKIGREGRGRTVVPEHHVVLEDIENSAHLREDEDSRALCLHRREELVEDDHLSGVVDDVLVGRVRGSGLGSVED
jgi:hypothetical protein